MALRINTNLASITAQKHLASTTNRLVGTFEKLSSGLRVVRASDDPAGLGISERMRARIRSFGQASRNVADGISLVQTGEGAMDEISNILTRMRELAVQSANGTYTGEDRNTLDEEVQQLVSEIDRISQATSYNGLNLLDGSISGVTLQIGVDTVAGVDTMDITLVSARTSDLTIDAIDIGSGGDTTSAIGNIDGAINAIVTLRGQFGAYQNRLNSTVNNISVAMENLQAAESMIRDVDVAFETANLTKYTIMQQAGISVLAQANVQPQAALNLLGG